MDNSGRFLDEYFVWLIDTLEVIQDSAAIKLVLQTFTKQCGFDCFAFGQIRSSHVRAISDYPDEWQRRYLTGNYLSFDPVVTFSKRSMRPFTWSTDDMRKQGSQIGRFATEAAAFGIRSGFSVPVKVGFGGVAILSLASARAEPDPVSVRDVASAVTAIAFTHIDLVRLGEKVVRIAEIGLSPREATCLKWAAVGKTKAETGRMLGLSERTVRSYLDQAMGKLGARNVTHAVGLAGERKLI